MADNLQDNLFGAIDSLAKRNIAATPADLTVDATVSAIANIDTGEYKVSYDGGVFSAFSLDPTIAYKQGDKVYVLVPQGNFSNKKVILGYAAYNNNVDYSQRQRMTNQYIPIGPNWLSPEWYAVWRDNLEIVAANVANGDRATVALNHPPANYEDISMIRKMPNTVEADVRYPTDNPPAADHRVPALSATGLLGDDDFKRVDSLLQHYSEGFEWFKIQADFRTDFMSIHSFGKYGVRAELIMENAIFLSLHREQSVALTKLQKKRITQAEYDATMADIQDRIDKIKAEHPGEEDYQNEYYLENYDLTFDNFNGNPYRLPQQVTQWAYFQVPKGAVRGLNKVSLFQDGKLVADDVVEATGTLDPITNQWTYPINPDGTIAETLTPNLKQNNIFATNLLIQWQQKVNLLDNLYYLWIETPQGDSLYAPGMGGSTYGVPNVDLVAHLYYGYENIMSPETCKVMWFREKLDYTEGKCVDEAERLYPTNPDTRKQDPVDPFGEDHLDAYGKRYIDYSEPGWIPIQWIKDNPDYKDGSGNIIPQQGEDWMHPENYTIDFNKLTVNINAVPYEWRYQCVVVYKGDVIMRAYQTIKRADSIYTLEIEHLIPESNKGQQLRIKDWLRPPGQIDAEATKVANPAYDPNNPGAPGANGQVIKFPEWWGRWWVDYGALQYYTYLGIENNNFTDDLEGIHGLIDIDNLLVNQRLIFKAQVYGIPGTGTIPGQRNPGLPDSPPTVSPLPPTLTDPQNPISYSEIANLEYQIVQDDSGALLPWYGELSFFYNTDGTIQSTDASIDHTAYARPEWFQRTGLNYELVYIAPDGTIVGSADSLATDPSRGWNTKGSPINSIQEKSMMTDVWCDANKVLHFHVRDIFDNEKVENTWIARLIFSDGSWIDSVQDFQFASPGDRGSNGSEWKAPIWPTNYPGMDGIGTNTLNFVQEISNRPVPIVLEGDSTAWAGRNPNDPSTWDWYKLQQPNNLQNHLVLRPFVRHATYGNVESLLAGGGTEPDKCYFYKVYWEAHYPADDWDGDVCTSFKDGPRSKTGWLSFKHLDGTGGFGSNFSGDNEGGVTGYIRTSEGAADKEKGQGRRAYTQYTNHTDDHFGAIEVVFNPPKTGITAQNCNFHFEIKARIEIYRCRPGSRPTAYDSAEWTASGEEGEYGLVSTISASYPVDFIVKPNTTTVDRYVVKTNWPREIMYDPSGYNPRFTNEELRLLYGEHRADYDINFDYSKNNSATNLTPITQAVAEFKHYVFDSITQQSFWDGNYYWKYEPKTYSTWYIGRNGAMFGPLVDTEDMPGGTPVGWFFRNQLIRLDSFGGNGSINGWDGQNIDINNGKGHILAPTVGAGWKDPFTNLFTGVIMGIDTSQVKSGNTLNFGKDPNYADSVNVSKQGYMTGLYGYQDGINSFGIMENGTAYFGRADSGGRIVIDGTNAQIYGGWDINPCDGEQFSYDGDPCKRTGGMWNRMRLNFLDIRGGTQQKPENSTSGEITNSVDVGLNNVQESMPVNGSGYYSAMKDFQDFFNKLNGWDGYFTTLQSGSPAIEIGQYCPDDLRMGTDESVIGLCEYNDNYANSDFMKAAHIPGFRRFLVTYDGNMYAMNAFIKGTLVGSNIIGSQFLSKDGNFAISEYGNMGIGLNRTLTPLEWPTMELTSAQLASLWSPKIPYQVDIDLRAWFNDDVSYHEYKDCGPYNFYVSKGGNVIANNIAIRGGRIDIGSFHLTGQGDLIQFGRSYFVGGYASGNKNPNATPPKGTYGVSINGSGPTKGETAVDIWGDLYGRGAFFNLGNIYLGGSVEKNHKSSGSNDFFNYQPSSINSPITMEVTYGTPGTLGNVRAPIRGSFWPLHFFVSSKLNNLLPNSPQLRSAWVNMPSGPNGGTEGVNDFMPVFGTRYLGPDVGTSGETPAWAQVGPQDQPGTNNRNFLARTSQNALFRVDSAGLWSDLILMRRFYPNADKMPASTRFRGQGNTVIGSDGGYVHDFDAMDNAELFFGVLSGDDGSRKTEVYGIKNISVAAPSFVLETPLNFRINAGRSDAFIVNPGTDSINDGGATYTTSTVFIQANSPGIPSADDGRLKAEILVRSGKAGGVDSLPADDTPQQIYNGGVVSASAGVIAIMGQPSPSDPDSYLDCYLRLNTTQLSYKPDPDNDNKPTFAYKYERGAAWMKGRCVILDGTPTTADVNNNNNISATVRVNRTFTGVPDPDSEGSVRLGARKLINFHGFTKGTTVLRVTDIDAEHQFGIYARFG